MLEHSQTEPPLTRRPSREELTESALSLVMVNAKLILGQRKFDPTNDDAASVLLAAASGLVVDVGAMLTSLVNAVFGLLELGGQELTWERLLG